MTSMRLDRVENLEIHERQQFLFLGLLMEDPLRP